jgi:hypothetical protein
MRSIVPAMLSGQHRVRILDAMRSWVSDPGRPDRGDDRDRFPAEAPRPFAAQRQPRHSHAIREHSPAGRRQSAPHGHLRVRPANCIRVLADGGDSGASQHICRTCSATRTRPGATSALRRHAACSASDAAALPGRRRGKISSEGCGRAIFVDLRLQPEAIATSANGNKSVQG